MKIALDITRTLETQRTGVANYQQYLFRNLLPISHDCEIVPTYYGVDKAERKQYEERNILSLRNPLMFRNIMLKDVLDIVPKWALIRNKIDLLHSTGYFTVKGFENRSIMTIHDLIFMYDDRYCHNEFFSDLMRRTLPKARKIIAISRTTKQDILKYCPSVAEHKIDIVYQGARDDYVPLEDVSEIHRFKREFFGDEQMQYILFLGTLTNRKNPFNVISAYADLVKKRRIGHKLVIAGKPADSYKRIMKMIKEGGLEAHVIVKQYVDDAAIAKLYASASVFVFPSFYEGFGLPVIEAMKCGCPCVVSNVSSLAELFHDAALLVDPHSPEEIGAAVYQLISQPEISEKFRQLGIEKGKLFSWQKTAENTLSVYRSTL